MQQVDFLKQIDSFSKHKDTESTLLQGNPEACPDPYISIVIPTYKRPECLQIALISALDQTNPGCSYEVIVVDNEQVSDSPSETEKMIKSHQNPRLLYYRNAENLGMVGNWNRCIILARAQWVAFLHDDDLLKPDYVSGMLKLLARRKNIGGIMAKCHEFSNLDDIEHNVTMRSPTLLKSGVRKLMGEHKLMRLYQVDSDLTLRNVYGPPTCGTIFRRDYLLASGGFSDAYYPSFDWFFLYTYCRQHKLYRSLSTLGYYRVFDNTSALDGTKAAFLRDRVMYANYASTHTFLGRVMKFLFADEQNNSILNSGFSAYTGKVDADYFALSETRERSTRKRVYDGLIKHYWLMKERFFLLFG